MADNDEDLVSKVSIDGLDETTKQLEEFGDKGAESFGKVAEAAAAAGVVIPKATHAIEKGAKSAGDSVQDLNKNLKSVDGQPTAKELREVESAARDLSARAVKVSKDLAQFATRIAALATAGAAAIVGIAKLGATVAAQVNQTTSAFDQNNAAQQRAVASSLNAEQASIQYSNQQRQLNRQLATGAITYDQYSETLKNNRQAYRDQIRVTAQLQEAQEAAREETERLQKAAADHKAFDDLTQTFGGPLTSALIALGNVAVATKTQFLDAFGPGAAAVVGTLTQALSANGSAISSFFSAAGDKISAFVNQNGPEIQKALSAIGEAAASIFNGLIDAMPSLLNFFNNQLVPAVKAVAGAVDGLVQGFNKVFGTNFTTGAAVVIVALTSMTGGFKTLLGVLGLIQPAMIVLRALFSGMLGPVGLLVIAFTTLYFAIDWQKFAQSAVAAGQAILGFFTSLPDKIGGFFSSIFSTVGDGWNALSQVVVDAWNGVVNFFTTLPDTITGIFQSIWDGIKNAFNDAVQSVENRIQSFVDTAKSYLQPILDLLTSIGNLGGSDGGADNVPAFAGGGKVRGPGSSTSDDILAWLSNNEYVMRAKAVRKYGTGFMNAVNSGRLDLSGIARFAVGGLVTGLTPAPALYAAKQSVVDGNGGGRGNTLNLSIGGEQFNGLIVPDDDTASRLTRYAINKQTRSAGRKPAWTGGGR